jgi:YHS domain-containing protein
MKRRTSLTHFAIGAALVLGLVAAPLTLAAEAALGGYCPVAYSAMDKAVKGDPKFTSVHDGKTYHLTNAKAKKMFDKAPQDYTVAYDGWCATAMAHGKKKESDPTLFVVSNGTTYLFSSKKAKAMFNEDVSSTIAKADSNWQTLTMARKGH